MRAFYNEIDPYCCAWLSNLMDAGHITPGKIDDRSIADLSPDDVRGFERVHFFAGIAGWELALSLSGYAGPVWTGSCPCQPFSAAGKGKASGDERHLWPEWFRLIRAVRPPIIVGEQVEAAIGWGWLDLVYSDLEEEGYTVGATVLPACSVGAPHIRQRLWFVANAESGNGEISISEWRQNQAVSESRGPSGVGELADRVSEGLARLSGSQVPRLWDATQRCAADAGELADTDSTRRRERRTRETGNGRNAPRVESSGFRVNSLGNPHSERSQGGSERRELPQERQTEGRQNGLPSGNGHWSDLQWLPCTDGKQRPTQPSIFPLAHGIPARVAKLRAAGNAIVPQVAAEFIKAAMQ